MISGISASLFGIHQATARHDAAAAVVAEGVSPDTPSVASDGNGLDTAALTMITARLAFRASLEAARMSHEMLDEAISLGDYTRT